MQANDRPLYIFDLDGTLSLPDHRRHLIEEKITCPECKGSGFDPVTSDMCNHPCVVCNGTTKVRNKSPNWAAFEDACHMDPPNVPVIKTFNQLYTIGAELLIWSARHETVRVKSVLWLSRHTGIQAHMIEQMLKMRPADESMPDEQLKRKWLHAMQKSQRARLTAVFDDRKKVVDMYRKAGVTVFQVAPGDF
jgi:hypothetical protein